MKANRLLKPLAAIVVSFVLGALILTLAGYDIGEAFSALWNGTFKDFRSFAGTINKSTPLIFVGLAVAIAFRGSVFNIGAEGQLLMGAVGAAFVGIYATAIPGPLLLITMILVGGLFGAIWGAIPGYFKAKFGASEVITTIMFNYIALQFIGFLVRGPLKDVSQAEPQSYAIAAHGFMPSLFEGTKLHFGFLLGVIIAVILYLLLFKHPVGYEIRAVGLNGMAAKTSGINVNRTIVGTMFLSGFLAGIGGAIQLSSVHYLLEGISPGYGFTGIPIAILVANNPLGVIFSSFLFGALDAGGAAMQRTAGISISFISIFQGIFIIAIAIAAVTSIKKRKKKEVKDNG